MFLNQLDTADATVFALSLVRNSALVMTLPKLGMGAYFFFYRLLLAVAITLTTAPMSFDTFSYPAAPDWLSLVIGELGIGLALGLSASTVVLGLLAAGQIVSQFLGFQIGSLQQGGAGESATDFRKLFFLVGLISWFAVGGHRIAAKGLMDSYHYFPVGQPHFSQPLFDLINQSASSCLMFAVRFSLPIVIVGMIGFMTAGLASRILGSGQTTQIGLGLNQILALILLPAMFIFYLNEMHAGTDRQLEQAVNFLLHQRTQ